MNLRLFEQRMRFLETQVPSKAAKAREGAVVLPFVNRAVVLQELGQRFERRTAGRESFRCMRHRRRFENALLQEIDFKACPLRQHAHHEHAFVRVRRLCVENAFRFAR